MGRTIIYLTVLGLLMAFSRLALAQNAPPLEPGDPPNLSLITVTPIDDSGFVEINGANNAVFPIAQLAVRNLYTGETVYTQAGITGSFRVQIFGAGNTPFLISPSQGTVSEAQRATSGSLPGGPALLLWGDTPNVSRDGVEFTLAGPLAGDGARWTATGFANRLQFASGEPNPLDIRLDVTVPQPSGVAASDLRFIGVLELEPIAVRIGDEMRAVASLDTNNGWSSVLTPSGLPIDDIAATIVLGEAVAAPEDIAPVVDGLRFRLEFSESLPDNLPDGLYVPVLRGLVRQGEAAPEAWGVSSAFGQGALNASSASARMPLVLNIGENADIPLTWALFMNNPSAGGRGLLPFETTDSALSGRIRYNPPTYILPPNALDGSAQPYSLEPFLPQMLPNAYDRTAAPLVPLAAESGRIQVRVEGPDGQVFSPPALTASQNQVGSVLADEQSLYGAALPLDIFQLSTLDAGVRAYTFPAYGEYTLRVSGEISDVFDNRYIGGGEYRVLVAEPLLMETGALSGTPFVTGDSLNPAVRLSPAVPADVTLTLTVYPLDGGAPQVTTLAGAANPDGIFQPEEGLAPFGVAGEYTLDIEARFVDAESRLWAASQRSAGVIADADDAFVARGERGLETPVVEPQQAWYRVETALSNAGIGSRAGRTVLNLPYQSGDVVWLPDLASIGLDLNLTVQDLEGVYQTWLVESAATDASALGQRVRDGAQRHQLPLALLDEDGNVYDPASADAPYNQSYRYLSAVRPALTIRQFTAGSALPRLPVALGLNEPLNGQIGAGTAGLLPGDYVFVFGGSVVRNPNLERAAASIYASVALIVEPDDADGARISPPARGSDGAADGGPLLVLDDVPYDAFFVPTGVQPGDVLRVGDRFSLSGQVAPALAQRVDVRITAPGGSERVYSLRANPVGYAYDPAQDFVVDETGLWTVEVRVVGDVQTSAGTALPPFITGGIPGAPDGIFTVYVVGPDDEKLENPVRGDLMIPSALAYNFNFNLPSGWTLQAAHYTLYAPGLLLEQGTLRLSGRSFSYQHNPSNLNQRFPNIEIEARVDGPSGSDARQLTFWVQATDDSGAPRLLYRTYTFFHDRLISLDDAEST